MNLLLDTHVWIWSQESPDEMGLAARSMISDHANRLFVATVSSLEIARMAQAGILDPKGNLRDWIRRSLDALRGETVELSHEIALGAYSLPGEFHRDPADRILVATARALKLTILSADARILGYPHVASRNARA